jgi:hypothetical protein
MRRILLVLPILMAAACSGNEKVPGNGAVPSLEVMSETPGDWSALNSMVGRTPFESGLLESSPVIVDMNATMGPEARNFRNAMADAGPLRRQGEYLVSRSRSGKAWLVLQPADHAFRAALQTEKGWRQWSTPGAEVPSLGN